MTRELIYLSPRKLHEAAHALEIREKSPKLRRTRRELELGAKLSLAPEISMSQRTASEPDGDRDETARGLLNRVEAELRARDMPAIDATPPTAPEESSWFHFHRRLRYGVGHADSRRSIRCLIMVDSSPQECAVRHGLLLHGSSANYLGAGKHVIAEDPGQRSGSSTDILFEWLAEHADWTTADGPLPDMPDHSWDPQWVLREMYNGFASHGWTDPGVQVTNLHACEGIARLTGLGVGDDHLIYVASPLAVWISPMTPLAPAKRRLLGRRQRPQAR